MVESIEIRDDKVGGVGCTGGDEVQARVVCSQASWRGEC